MASSSVVFLPNELVTDIMSRVPGKSVARFRVVSKQFKSLLSDPCFQRLHRDRSRDSLFSVRIVLQAAYSDGPCHLSVANEANDLVHIYELKLHSYLHSILDCHHQLLCFACETCLYLCDPVNKELKRLPVTSPACLYKSGESLVSFGFVEATRQFKVVKWPEDLEENRRRKLPSGLITTWKKVDVSFQVLNIDILEDGRLKVSGWRRSQAPCPYLLQLSSKVHVNGFIYWTTSDFQLVSFSLQEETFSTLNSPPSFPLGTQDNRLISLSGRRGNLWMVDYHLQSHIVEIWKMMKDNAWAQIHKIDIQESHPHPWLRTQVHILDIGLDQVVLTASCRWGRICYDVKTNTIINYYDNLEPSPCHTTDGLLSLRNIC